VKIHLPEDGSSNSSNSNEGGGGGGARDHRYAQSQGKALRSFDADGTITGFVKLSLPDKGRLYHYGVKVCKIMSCALSRSYHHTSALQLQVIQSIVFHDPTDVCIDLCTHTHEIMPEGYIS
jgi:hypothetical protein